MSHVDPWKPHVEYERNVEVHTRALWSLLQEFRSELASKDGLVIREIKRMLDESLYAVTEVKVGLKYDIRYVSEGVRALCERHSDPYSRWCGKEKAPAFKLNHDHVQDRSRQRLALLTADTKEAVEAILRSSEACTVPVWPPA